MQCTKVKRNQRRILESFLQLLSLELSPVTEAKVSAMEKGELPLVTISQQDHKAGSAEEYSFLSDTLSLAWPLCTQSCKLGQAWVSCVRISVHACACTCVCMYVLCIHRSLRLVLGVSLYHYIVSETRWPGDYQLSKTIGPASPGPACLPTPRARFTGITVSAFYVDARERTQVLRLVQQTHCCQNHLPSLMPGDLSWGSAIAIRFMC